jgi:hemerythrin-like domain-containing protein
MDPFIEAHDGLVTIHHALIGSLHAVASATSVEIIVPQARAAGGFLLGHHQAEDTILFAGLRRLGRLRSTDVAFLETCDRAHHELHALCDRLLAAANAGHPDVDEIARLGRETQQALSAHTALEEAGLAPERLREMISEEGLREIGREAEAHRATRQRQR